jgi:cellulose synthase/poly-beta-1,6-N-acetylglucosamine synthase-like glycosyltransferase
MVIIFWSLLLLIVYCYFGYPLLLKVFSRLLRRDVQSGEYEPAVSVVLSVWNEEDVIRQKIKNLLSLDYPPEKIEILIGSDGSNDQTNGIVRQFIDPRIRLIENPRREGKMATLNNLVSLAKHEIIVFTDARQTFEKDVIKVLAGNFHDPRIGCVSGELIFFEKDGATAKGINLYWNYEKFIRLAESQIHSMLGATGAIYAIRRELFENIPEQIVLDDMFVPFKIIQKGYRAIFDPSARAFDDVADSPREEHRRKARTLFGNYQIFWMFRRMFNPLTSPIAIQLFSHKFLRVLVPFFLIGLFLINGIIIRRGVLQYAPLFYVFTFFAQILFYAMAMIGGLARYQKHGILKAVSKACYIPYVFCLLNFSALVGFMRFIGSKQEAQWEKARG